ncbi:MAG: hypothetical protein Crog4KO_14440 [Crocinitomicaceae bacterium]
MKQLAFVQIKGLKKAMMMITGLVWIGMASSCFNGYSENEAKEKEHGFCGVVTESDLNSARETPSIFKAKCATCHYLTKDATGPKLIGILDRVPSEDWLRNFITNEDSLTRIKDSATLAIQKMKPTSGNHNFQSLSENQLNTLIDYIQ